MPLTTVSPMFQGWPWPMRHSRVGIKPVRAPGRSMSSSTPRPKPVAPWPRSGRCRCAGRLRRRYTSQLFFSAAAQVERAVAALAPAMEPRVAEVEIAGAVDPVARRDRPGLQRRQRHRHLEGRAGRIQPGGRVVDQRRAPVLRPLRPLRLRHAGIEQRRIERRVGGHRQHLAVAAVQHHGAGALVAEPVEHRLLQPGVDREADFLARHALLAVQLADHPADRVHLELHRAGAAAQREIVVLLHPGAADPDAGQRQQRVVGHIAPRWAARRSPRHARAARRTGTAAWCRHRPGCRAGRAR